MEQLFIFFHQVGPHAWLVWLQASPSPKLAMGPFNEDISIRGIVCVGSVDILTDIWDELAPPNRDALQTLRTNAPPPLTLQLVVFARALIEQRFSLEFSVLGLGRNGSLFAISHNCKTSSHFVTWCYLTGCRFVTPRPLDSLAGGPFFMVVASLWIVL